MKEIGAKLKETRENNGIDLKEAAEDLKLRVSQLENIENGNIKAFKDVFYLKYFIKDYAKYLGLDPNLIIDEFNEFLFDYTSRIPTEDIKKAIATKKKNNKSKKREIVSPYTYEKNVPFFMKPIFIYIVMGILVILIIYFLVSLYGIDAI